MFKNISNCEYTTFYHISRQICQHNMKYKRLKRRFIFNYIFNFVVSSFSFDYYQIMRIILIDFFSFLDVVILFSKIAAPFIFVFYV